MVDNEKIEEKPLNKETTDFLSNTEPPRGENREKTDIVTGVLYEYVITSYEADISGDYGIYSRYDIIDDDIEKCFYLGSSVDQKTMNRYIEGWLKEGHEYPFKVKFVRYPRKSQKKNQTYYDIRADLIASGKNVK